MAASMCTTGYADTRESMAARSRLSLAPTINSCAVTIEMASSPGIKVCGGFYVLARDVDHHVGVDQVRHLHVFKRAEDAVLVFRRNGHGWSGWLAPTPSLNSCRR